LEGENPNKPAIEWFQARFDAVLIELEDHFGKYKMSDALMSMYKLIWDDFCAWYLEMVKPGYEQPIDQETYNATIHFFEQILKVAHPFMPFITEELWHELADRAPKDCIIVAEWPKPETVNTEVLAQTEQVFEIITNVRNIRNSKQIGPKVPLVLLVTTQDQSIYLKYDNLLKKLSCLSAIEFVTEEQPGAIGFVVKADSLYIPLEGEVDMEKEKENMLKELEYNRGFLISVDKKLSNERFVSNAPEAVLNIERQKQADAIAKIKSLEQRLGSLGMAI